MILGQGSLVFVFVLMVFLRLELPICADMRAKELLTPNQCRSSHFFDTFNLACVPCSSLVSILFAANQSGLLESSPQDKTTCVCQSNLTLDVLDGKLRCINHTCDEAGQVYMQGECGYCEQSGCQCLSGEVLRKEYELDSSNNNQSSVRFRCVKPSADFVTCHFSYLLASGQSASCECPQSSHVEEDGMCLPQRKLISIDTRVQHSTVRYESKFFISQLIYRSLRPAIYNCNNLKNQTACHHLLNMCVLKLTIELADIDSSENKGNLCLFLNHINPNVDFQLDSYYVSDHRDTMIEDRFRANDHVNLMSISYDQGGRLREMSPFSLSDLFICESAKLQHNQINFGTSISSTCRWTSTELWRFALQRANNHFVELYFVSGNSKLYPVAVMTTFGEQVASRWITKRFFLVNSQIGIDMTKLSSLYHHLPSKFALYARSVSLQIQISKHSNDGKIYPPILTIDYETISESVSKQNKTLETTFNLVFHMSDSNVKYKLNLVTSILGLFSIMWATFRTWCWSKRSDRNQLDLCVIATFVVEAMSAMSNILLSVSLFFVINQVIIFKFQSIIHTLMLTPEQESTIIIYLIIAFVLKLIQLFRLILLATSVDIFFLDWEKPRKKESQENFAKNLIEDGANIDYTFGYEKQSEQIEQHAKRQAGPSAISNSSPSNLIDQSANVSIWRSYFVANEWCELCRKRRIRMDVHICSLILFLECTSLNKYVKVMPFVSDTNWETNHSLREIPESIAARIAFASLFYITLAICQFLYQKYLRENLGGGKLNEFIDLCSVSNISVLCLMHRKYGYYLHGQSPSGRSDVNMLEMYRLLEMEESDLCSKRGLQPNTEQQTFEILLPAAVQQHWKALRAGFDKSNVVHTPFLMSQRKPSLRDFDKVQVVQTHFAINRFLCSFIEHNFPKVDYVVQDRTGIESLLNFESVPVQQKGRFYNDNGHSFENVLLYGIEVTVTIFEFMTFLMVDLITRNFVLAAVFTYLTSKAIEYIFNTLWRKNLICKTLMDERFLI